jgi:hypothetical protein
LVVKFIKSKIDIASEPLNFWLLAVGVFIVFFARMIY